MTLERPEKSELQTERPNGRSIPIPAERHARILEFIGKHGAASIHAIAAEISASSSTVRRDLDELTERGYLERTHGGAALRSRNFTTFEPSREIAERIALPEKIAIGTFAASLLESGQSVIFDSSSTVHEAARAAVARDLSFTAVTTDIGIAQELNRSPRIRVIVPGGTMRKESFTLMGEPAVGFLATLSVDIAFIGIHSLAGLKASETSLEIAGMKRALIAASQRVVVLADASKFESPAFCEVATLDAFQDIVTDDGISNEMCDSLRERGIRLHVAAKAVTT